MESDFADNNPRSRAYARVRDALLQLAHLPTGPRTWRPHAVVLAQGTDEPVQLMDYAVLLSGPYGLVSRVAFLPGSLSDAAVRRDAELARLRAARPESATSILNEVIVGPDTDTALAVFLQAYGLGPLKPNLAVLGAPGGGSARTAFVQQLRVLAMLKVSSAIALNTADQQPMQEHAGRIDIWWRGYANGSLMLVLAHLMTLTREWQKVRVRVLRVAKTEAERQTAAEIEHLIGVSRIAAEAKILDAAEPFSATLRRESRDAAAVFLGFVLPDDDKVAMALFDSTIYALEGMPPTFLISTSGAADLLA